MIGRNGQIVTDCLHPLSLATQPRDTALQYQDVLFSLNYPSQSVAVEECFEMIN
jgi:hypothetical protein